jgi:hypothetical protein
VTVIVTVRVRAILTINRVRHRYRVRLKVEVRDRAIVTIRAEGLLSAVCTTSYSFSCLRSPFLLSSLHFIFFPRVLYYLTLLYFTLPFFTLLYIYLHHFLDHFPSHFPFTFLYRIGYRNFFYCFGCFFVKHDICGCVLLPARIL